VYATKHKKDQFVFGDLSKLGIILVIPDIDTDLLGAFKGEIAREGTPKDIVLKKARLGMNSSALACGAAS
jgi:hypothetical protein